MSDDRLQQNRNFCFYFIARIVSQLGDNMYLFAASWYLMDITGSGFHMATIQALNSLLFMILSYPGGLLADRKNRKGIMITTDLIQGFVLIILTLLIGTISIKQSVTLLYAITLIHAGCGAFFSPAANAIIPALVDKEKVSTAAALSQGASSLCTIVGMTAGALCYESMGINGILILNASTNLIAALLEGSLVIKHKIKPPTTYKHSPLIRKAIRDSLEGLKEIWSDSQIRSLLTINTIFNLVVLPIPMIYLPVIFNLYLGAEPRYAAFIQAGTWLGIITGTWVASLLLRKFKAQSVMTAGLVALSLATFSLTLTLRVILGLPLVVSSILLTVCNLVAGTSAGIFNVPIYTLYHAWGRDEMKGRFWGMEAALRTAATACGYIFAGILSGFFSPGFIFTGITILMVLLSIWTYIIQQNPRAHN